MATAAQIEANRRNALRSTLPKTDEGKNRVRSNALKHGMTALTLLHELPQEDPKRLEERTDRYTNTLQPDNAVEYDMVVQIAQLSHAIERGERIEMAHLAGRVRMAARLGPETGNVSAEEIKKIHELGS